MTPPIPAPQAREASGPEAAPGDESLPSDPAAAVASGPILPEGPPRSLKSRVLRGTAITVVGFGSAQVLRIVSSVVLTRLLLPDAYGQYRLANVFLEGLAFFTAIGAGPAVIRDKRGDDPVFLHTAWTLQAVRGFGLWIAACLLAVPYAYFYHQPVLWYLIPIVGLTVLLDSFDSVAIHWSQRHMKLGWITGLELARQVTTLVVTIGWAVLSATVWAFPAGAIAGCIVVLVLSHTMLPGPKSRFGWDRDAAHALYHLGKFVFASSVLEFLSRQLDLLMLARCVSIGMVGVYGLAVNLSEPMATLNMRMSRQVLFPTFSITHRERPEQLSRVFYRARLGIEALHLPLLGVLMIAGDAVVRLLLSSRFWEAGWIFQLLCIRTAMKCIGNPLSVCCVAIDTTRTLVESLVFRMVWVSITVPLGWYFWGLQGVVWAAALSELPALLVLYWTLWKLGIVRPWRELISPAMVGVGCLIGWALLRIVH